MRPLSLTLLALLLTWAPPRALAAEGQAGEEPLDYTLLTHDLSIDMLRAGAHNGAEPDQYYFAVTMYCLLNSPEERNSEFAKRKQVAAEVGRFGDTKIDALALWRPNDKTKDVKEIHIDGNAVRELVAKAMSQLQTPESGIMVQTDIRMMVLHKKFFFFGDDALVAKASFYPIPPTKFDVGLRTNQPLAIVDDKGTNVKILVRYAKPAVAAKAKDSTKEPSKDSSAK